MKEFSSEDFKVNTSIRINDKKTSINLDASKKELKKHLKHDRKKLSKLQDKLYAHGKYAVLICIQGMDTSGKDSLIREVFKDLNARGVVVHSFKVPTDLERKHDYLWRHYIALPERGKFGVFNRTHYENVLVSRVHPEIILGENLPDINSLEDITKDFWEKRFEQINNFEKTIAQNGTIIFKFFLNISKDEQKYRLLRRLDKPEKNWKFNPGDLDDRDLWDEYSSYYEEAINKTSTAYAPWYIIPSDDKNTARLIVSQIMLDELKKYKSIKHPELLPEYQAMIPEYIERLKND